MVSYTMYKEAFADIPKPFAFLDLDKLNQNIQQIITLSEKKQIRIASKSLRSIDVMRHILAADAKFCGIMCFTAPEALFLAEQGFHDLLLGYPIWNPNHIAAIARMTAAGTPITLMVDSLAHVEHIESIARKTGVVLRLCLDVDCSMDFFGLHFGVWRSPIRSVQASIALAERIAASEHLQLDGIMGYEAQIAGVGDANPNTKLRNPLIRFLKLKSAKELAAKREQLVTALRSKGIVPRFVNGGGSGSLHTTCKEDVVTEVTVGSAFYAPGLFDHYRAYRFQPAAGYAIEIVRQPRSDIYTCQGGGYTASGAIALDKLPVPYLPEGARLLPMEGAGEVQTPIRYNGHEKLQLGDPVFLRHSKAGELCERFMELQIYSQGKAIQVMKTYRGEGRCFL